MGRKHGAAQKNAKTSEYVIWCSMKSRCANPKNKHFADYGGRGIYVCAEWQKSFSAFLAHIGPRPGPQFTVDRINNDMGYSPGNVKWATHREQALNRRKGTRLGRALCGIDSAVDIAKKTGLSAMTIRMRYKIGYRGDDLYADSLLNRRPAHMKGRKRTDMCKDHLGRFSGKTKVGDLREATLVTIAADTQVDGNTRFPD